MLATARKMRKEEGLTLIELPIVVVILGALSAVAVFSVGGITDRAKNVACGADKAAVTVAAQAFIAQNGVPAASIDALVADGFLGSRPLAVRYTPTKTSFTATGVAPCAP